MEIEYQRDQWSLVSIAIQYCDTKHCKTSPLIRKVVLHCSSFNTQYFLLLSRTARRNYTLVALAGRWQQMRALQLICFSAQPTWGSHHSHHFHHYHHFRPKNTLTMPSCPSFSPFSAQKNILTIFTTFRQASNNPNELVSQSTFSIRDLNSPTHRSFMIDDNPNKKEDFMVCMKLDPPIVCARGCVWAGAGVRTANLRLTFILTQTRINTQTHIHTQTQRHKDKRDTPPHRCWC